MSDCWNCKFQVGMDEYTAERMRRKRHQETGGLLYEKGHGASREGIVSICTKHAIVASEPFYKCGFSEDPGSEG